MTCAPCEKEIINNGARGLGKLAHKKAKQIPQMILDGQVSKEDGEAFLRELMAVEKPYCYGLEHALKKLAEKTTPIYDLPKHRGRNDD